MKCAHCGYPRSEHHYNGACYGLCGEFEEMKYSPLSFFWHRSAARAQKEEECLQVYEKLADGRWGKERKRSFAKVLKAIADLTKRKVER